MFVAQSRRAGIRNILVAGLALLAFPTTTVAAPGAQVPLCVVGSWRAADFAGAFGELLGGVEGIEATGGDVLMAVQPSGVYEVSFTDVTMNIDTPVGLGILTMEATGRGVLSESGPGMLASTGDEFGGSIMMTLGGETMTESLDTGSAGDGAPAPYECSGNRLVMMIDVGDGKAVQLAFGRQ